MIKTFFLLWGSIIYMEVVYHLACFGFSGCNPLLLLPVSILFAGLGTLLTGFMRKKGNKVILWILQSIGFLLFASQVVYMKIFKQPLLIAAVQNAGGMALKNYWREALSGILAASGFLLLLAVPLVVTGVLLKLKWLTMSSHKLKGRVISIALFSGGILGFFVVMFIGHLLRADFYEEYREFYDPYNVIERYGVVASLQRDLAGGILPRSVFEMESFAKTDSPEVKETLALVTQLEEQNALWNEAAGEGEAEGQEEEPEILENVLPIDFDKLEQITADVDDLRKATE